MKQLDMFEELKPKIYESPDNGKTVYERNFGEQKRRLVVYGGSGYDPTNSEKMITQTDSTVYGTVQDLQ